MPLILLDTNRNRIVDELLAYLRGRATETSVYEAVYNASFRDEELWGILIEAETAAREIDTRRKHMLMLTVKAGLKDRLLLT